MTLFAQARRWLILAIALITSLGAWTAAAQPVQAAGTTLFRILNASPNSPAVDVYANNQQVAAGLSFQQFGQELSFPAGRIRVRFFATGANPATSRALIDVRLVLARGRSYIIASTGYAAQMRPQLIIDPTEPPSTRTRIRLVNLDPAAPAVDLVNLQDKLILSRISYRGAKTITLAPSTYSFKVRVSKTKQVAFETPAQPYEGRSVYTLWLFAPSGAARAQTANADYKPAVVITKQ